jgi:hypothetical protein
MARRDGVEIPETEDHCYRHETQHQPQPTAKDSGAQKYLEPEGPYENEGKYADVRKSHRLILPHDPCAPRAEPDSYA